MSWAWSGRSPCGAPGFVRAAASHSATSFGGPAIHRKRPVRSGRWNIRTWRRKTQSGLARRPPGIGSSAASACRGKRMMPITSRWRRASPNLPDAPIPGSAECLKAFERKSTSSGAFPTRRATHSSHSSAVTAAPGLPAATAGRADRMRRDKRQAGDAGRSGPGRRRDGRAVACIGSVGPAACLAGAWRQVICC